MMKRQQALVFFVFILSIYSCSQTQPIQQNTQTAEFKKCPTQRSQMCTREYLPVCATRDTGVRCVTTPCPSSEQKTYGNGCSACADKKVLGYIPDACTTEPNVK